MFQGLESRAKADLRERGEAAVSRGAEFNFSFGASDPSKLLHELQVREVELRLQNQALLEALHEAQVFKAKYQDLYESAPVAYIGVRRDGTIAKLNRCGVALLGGTPGRAADLLGQSITDFTTPESAAHVQALVSQALSGCGEVHREQIELRTQLVMPVYVAARAKAYRPIGSQELHVRLMLTDVTALHMAKNDVVRHMMKLGN